MKTQITYAKKNWQFLKPIFSKLETGLKKQEQSEASFVLLALQDMFTKLGINMKVTLEAV